MQPYFFPYAGYFRLFAAVDEFVLFDCVQFPRRGRVHRAPLPDAGNSPQWLTLPLANQARDIRIRDLQFTEDARARLDARLDRLPWLRASRGPGADDVEAYLRQPLDDVTDYLEQGLRLVTRGLGFERPIVRSSGLDIDPLLRGQARVIAIAQAVGATHYINPSGGKSLYDSDAFSRGGLELQFMPAYSGSYFHLLPALVAGQAPAIRDDILASLALGTEAR